MFSGRGLCDELTTRPEESYRLWLVVVCGLEDISFMNEVEGRGPLGGYSAKEEKSRNFTFSFIENSVLHGPNQLILFGK